MRSEGEVRVGRELDIRIACEVLHLTVQPWADVLCYVKPNEQRWPLPFYSTQIEAAWLVVEHLRQQGCVVELWCYPPVEGESCSVSISRRGRGIGFGLGDTMPEAICKAALAALEVPR